MADRVLGTAPGHPLPPGVRRNRVLVTEVSFRRPTTFPVSSKYMEAGPHWDWHMTKSGLWARGKQCQTCKRPVPIRGTPDVAIESNSTLLREPVCECEKPVPLGFHKGIDFACPVGSPVRAPISSLVDRCGWENAENHSQGFGMRIRLYFRIDREPFSLYLGHLSHLHVKESDYVYEGQVIALSGNTGHSTGAHLHMEVRDSLSQQHPMNFRDDIVV